MKVALVCLRWCQYGGWPSYLFHLEAALKANGCDVTCLSVDSPTGYTDRVGRTAGVDFKQFDIVNFAVSTCKAPYPDLSQFGSNLVFTIHDPTEFIPVTELFGTLGHTWPFVHFDRQANMRSKFGRTMPYAHYICHPYKRASDGQATGNRVVCTSRIDWDKNTHLILQADCGVELWTGGVNRMYAFKSCGVKNFKEHPAYHGAFETPAQVYEGACVLVDMSVISGDGGGTQYTFLEAMDYGLGLVLNSDWSTGHRDDELKPFVHFYPANLPIHIRAAVQILKAQYMQLGHNPYQAACNRILKNHNHVKVGAEFVEMFKNILNGKFEQYNTKKSGIAAFMGKH